MIGSLILFCALAAPTLEQNTASSSPPSPCPDVFTYVPPVNTPGEWKGQINLTTKTTLNSLSLIIVLDEKADILGNWIGDVTTQDNKKFKIEIHDIQISPGPPFPFGFFVKFNLLNKTPRVQTIKFNGRVICNANSFSEVITTTKTPNRFQPENSNSKGQSQCGLVLLNSAIPLVVDGAPTSEGQWPWQIAIYRVENLNYYYICGGTLVTRRHVITAGHCASLKMSSESVEPGSLNLFLGSHNLRTSMNGLQLKVVAKIKMHPDFDRSTLWNDIAILELRSGVQYTNWVQPACLWPEDQKDVSYIVGKNGSVVGWGLTEVYKPSEELTLAVMPVVNLETCLKSNPSFFERYNSDNIFCAGARDGTSVCNGDSGGGMVFYNNGAWYLRGVVSLAVSLVNKRQCDPFHYVIFTDIAQYLPWIKQNIDI